ncbi:MAG TPA: sorbosone dehydrogenase, partial [Balneola sp.]|nr:sorbosone dehydrogenase [Balneola sp.]
MRILLFVLATLLISCSSKESKDLIPEKSGPSTISLGYLEAPAGFEISIFAEDVTNARQ